MEQIPENSLLQYNPDTLKILRKQYNLENPKRINDAIEILEEWLKKQDHFNVKEMSKDHLERLIILNKGSIEKVKTRLDTLFTCRTLFPIFFQLFDADEIRKDKVWADALLPKMTPNHDRVYVLKYAEEKYDLNFMNYYQWFIAACEYVHTHDYCNGMIIVLDYMDTNVLNLIKALNLNELQQIVKIMEGLGLRLKAIHVITPSSCVNIIVSFIRQVTSAKIGQRIYTHKNFDTLYDTISKDILPIEYGGKEKSIHELHVDLVNALTSEQFTDYLKEVRSSCTNEALRQKNKLRNDLMGISGSFRSLCID